MTVPIAVMAAVALLESSGPESFAFFAVGASGTSDGEAVCAVIHSRCKLASARLVAAHTVTQRLEALLVEWRNRASALENGSSCVLAALQLSCSAAGKLRTPGRLNALVLPATDAEAFKLAFLEASGGSARSKMVAAAHVTTTQALSCHRRRVYGIGPLERSRQENYAYTTPLLSPPFVRDAFLAECGRFAEKIISSHVLCRPVRLYRSSTSAPSQARASDCAPLLSRQLTHRPRCIPPPPLPPLVVPTAVSCSVPLGASRRSLCATHDVDDHRVAPGAPPPIKRCSWHWSTAWDLRPPPPGEAARDPPPRAPYLPTRCPFRPNWGRKRAQCGSLLQRGGLPQEQPLIDVAHRARHTEQQRAAASCAQLMELLTDGENTFVAL